MPASVLLTHRGFPLDDSWIHQTIARNLANSHALGFLPGQFTGGSSSPLWSAILALPYTLGFIHPLLYSTFINSILFGMLGVLLKRLANDDKLPRTESWILALAPLLNGNFIWLGLAGMEHVLFVTLSAAAICFWFSPAPKHASLCALCLMLLVLTRPEGLLLIAVLLAFRRRTLRTAKHVFVCVGGVVVGQALLWAINWKITHTLMSVTMKGRQWLYFGPNPIGVKGRVNFEILSLIRTTLNIWATRSFARLTTYHSSILLVFAAVALSVWLILSVYRAGF